VAKSGNLAFSLAEDQGAHVLAIDLSMPFGDLDLYLTGEQHEQDLADISSQSERLDQSLLRSMVMHVGAKLDLIASPSTFEKTVHVEPDRVSELVRVAGGVYDYILLDFGATLDHVGIWAVDHLDELCLVATPSMPSLRRAGQLLELTKAFDKPVPPVTILLNRADTSERISVGEIEKVLGRPIGRIFPSDPGAVEESLLIGRPVLQVAPKSRLSRTVADWAAQLAGGTHRKQTLWQRLKIR
jgi:pilus assembly protein CpaE